MVKLFSRLGKTVTKGLQDVGGASPPLASYRFVSVSGSKTATVLLYDTDGNVMAQETLTVTTTPLQATNNSLWAGDWDPAYAGMQVLSADVGIYALPTNGSPEVTTSNGRLLAANSVLGAVPGLQISTLGTLPVSQRGCSSTRILSAATHVISSGPIYIDSIRVTGGTMGLVTIYKGSTLDPIHTSVTPAQGNVLAERLHSELGLTIVLAAATEVVVTYRDGG